MYYLVSLHCNVSAQNTTTKIFPHVHFPFFHVHEQSSTHAFISFSMISSQINVCDACYSWQPYQHPKNTCEKKQGDCALVNSTPRSPAQSAEYLHHHSDASQWHSAQAPLSLPLPSQPRARVLSWRSASRRCLQLHLDRVYWAALRLPNRLVWTEQTSAGQSALGGSGRYGCRAWYW